MQTETETQIESCSCGSRLRLVSALLVLMTACSGGRSALSPEPIGAPITTASSSETSDLPACGSMTKPCDPQNLGGATCSSLGAGSGTLLCDPETCSYDRSMCTETGTTGGGGLGALLGAFGRNQGGRAATGQATGNAGGRGGRGGEGGRGEMRNSQGQREDGQEESQEAGQGARDGADDDGNESDDAAGQGGSGNETQDAGTAIADAGSPRDAGNSGGDGQSGEPEMSPDTPAPM